MTATILNIVIGGLLLGGIYALISMGLSLQYGVARVLNIAHGEFIMVGAFATFSLYTVCGINPLVSLVIVGPGGLIIGFILHRTLFKHLRTSSASLAAFEGRSLLATFGLLFIIQYAAKLEWGGYPRTYLWDLDLPLLPLQVDLWGTKFLTSHLVALLLAVVIGLAFYLFLARTRQGKAIRAAAQDPATAGLMGVDINWVLALCFGLGALMAGVAGVLYSMCFSIYTTMGLEYTLIAIIVVVLGGLGSIPGSFIGGFILGIVSKILDWHEPVLSVPAFYLIFIILLLVRPKGILGK